MKEYTKWARQTSAGTLKKKYVLFLLWKTDNVGTPLTPLKYKIEEYIYGKFQEETEYVSKNLAFATFYKLVSDAWQEKLAEEGLDGRC